MVGTVLTVHYCGSFEVVLFFCKVNQIFVGRDSETSLLFNYKKYNRKNSVSLIPDPDGTIGMFVLP